MDIRYLVLCLTTRCNLSCAYCYLGETPVGIDMSEEVLSKSLRLAASGSEPLHVQLTGGEPTLVPELIFRAVLETRRLTRPTTIAIQTNATLLTSEVVDFLKCNDVQVGVSLDGPPTIQERLRGRAADTLKGLALLESMGVPFLTTAVVSNENVGQLDRLVLSLAGFKSTMGIGLDLLVRKGRAESGLLPAAPRMLQKGLSAMLKALSSVNERRSVPINLRELSLLGQCTPAKSLPKTFCLAARRQSLAVHPDGRLYPCSQCLGEDAFNAGDVWKPSPAGLTLLPDHRLFSDECRDCQVFGNCPGDCPSRIYHNNKEDILLACTLYRTLWESQHRCRSDC